MVGKARAKAMNVQRTSDRTGYVETTSSASYESWPWYIACMRALEIRKTPGWKPRNPLPQGRPLPVSTGIRFGTWVMETPTIRDIIYRRFVKGDYDNEVESMLLKAASFHFLHQDGYSVMHFAPLALCWRPIARILTGEYTDARSPEYRADLLTHPLYFTAEEST